MNTSWKEVKAYLKERIDSSSISPSEITGKSGLSKDSYYTIFATGREDSPMRKSTVYGLATALNLSVTYTNKFPQFSEMNLIESNNVPIHFAREALQMAIKEFGDVEGLAEKILIPVSYLNEILSPNASKQMQISRDLFVTIGYFISKKLTIDPTGKLEYVSPEPFTMEKMLEHLVDPENMGFDFTVRSEDVKDSGLQELFNEKNIEKYDITIGDRIELSKISIRRKSDTTLDHWVSILYTLRSLNK